MTSKNKLKTITKFYLKHSRFFDTCCVVGGWSLIGGVVASSIGVMAAPIGNLMGVPLNYKYPQEAAMREERLLNTFNGMHTLTGIVVPGSQKYSPSTSNSLITTDIVPLPNGGIVPYIDLVSVSTPSKYSFTMQTDDGRKVPLEIKDCDTFETVKKGLWGMNEFRVRVYEEKEKIAGQALDSSRIEVRGLLERQLEGADLEVTANQVRILN